jgi:2-desacetyl-2-hydroxyethyl bacteriochlorophyllide A dehydrogenase
MPKNGGEKAYGVVWPALNTVEIEEFDMPVPKEGEMLLETEVTLISPGTERHWLIGRNDLTRMGRFGGYPFRPGYSFSGYVKELGPGVTGFKVGEKVICAARHASHVVVPAVRVTKMPQEIDLEEAVFHSLGTVAIQALRRAFVEVGESVAVFGLGPIGLLTLQIARLCGAMPVIGVDLIDSRLKRGLNYGADIVFNAKDEEKMKKYLASLKNGGPAVVVELTAAQQPLETCLEVVQRLGRVIMTSSMEGAMTINLHSYVHEKGVYLIGAQTGARAPGGCSRPGIWSMMEDMDVWVQLLQYHRLEAKSLVTHNFAAKDAPKAYELIKVHDPDLIGALLHWK